MYPGPKGRTRGAPAPPIPAALEALETRVLFAFGVTSGTTSTGQSTYVIDNGGDLRFSIIKGGSLTSTIHLADVSAIQYKGKELLAPYNSPGPQRYSHYEQGLGSSTVISYQVDATHGWILITCNDSSDTDYPLIQYYAVRKNDNNIYMASLPTDMNHLGLGEGRFIAYLDRSVFPNPEAPSDNNGTSGAIEGSDVFGHPDGTTSSKFYNMGRRMIDNIYHGVTGSAGGQTVGAWMFMGNREHSAGGPFFKDIDFQSGGSDIEIYNCLFTGHTQTEPFRAGLQGPYAFQFTDGSTPTAPDYSWLETLKDSSGNLLIRGLLPASQRGSLTGKESGVPSGHDVVIGLSNAAAQYWTRPDANGNYTLTGIQPGTYTETLYDGELAVGTKTVSITAGATSQANIVDSFYLPTNPIFRIGAWDGTPLGFMNSQPLTPGAPGKIEIMHPSDIRMTPWNSIPNFVIGTNTDSQWPLAQFMGVNNSKRITFNLTSAQVQNLTLRIGISWGFSGARPKITVNSGKSYAWTSGNPSPSADLNSRGITRGTWRGVNQLYTFNIPSTSFRAGTNTIDLPLISGSYQSGQTWLSPNVAYDAIDLVPTTTAAAAAIASVTITPTSSINANGTRTFTAVGKDSKGNVIPANFDWSASAGTIDANGNYLAPASAGSDTITAAASETGIAGYNTNTRSSTFFGGAVTGIGNTTITINPPLQVSSGGFQYQTQQAVVLNFNRAVDSNLLAGAFALNNVDTHAVVPTAQVQLSDSNLTGTFTFSDILPDGNYRVTLPAAATLNSSGDRLASDYTLDFFVLSGDANRDGYVNAPDFTLLAQNYNRSPATFGEGDFNYDGRVNALDFNALARRFGAAISAPAAPLAPSLATIRSLFSTTPVATGPSKDLLAVL